MISRFLSQTVAVIFTLSFFCHDKKLFTVLVLQKNTWSAAKIHNHFYAIFYSVKSTAENEKSSMNKFHFHNFHARRFFTMQFFFASQTEWNIECDIGTKYRFQIRTWMRTFNFFFAADNEIKLENWNFLLHFLPLFFDSEINMYHLKWITICGADALCKNRKFLFERKWD